MRAKPITLAAALVLSAHLPVMADDSHKEEHGGQIFHMFRLEADTGVGRDDTVSSWDFDGWIGTDENKLWLKSEGEAEDGEPAAAEFWAMASRNIDMFWDAQIGVRYDSEPHATTYIVAGFEGLAPYFLETEAHLFVSRDGDASARLRVEKDWLLTQRLVLQPYAEMEAFKRGVPELEKGAGLASGEFGLQVRYEVTRAAAPYVDLRYERAFGNTAALAARAGERRGDIIAGAGVRLMF